jgi:hypothetical protein
MRTRSDVSRPMSRARGALLGLARRRRHRPRRDLPLHQHRRPLPRPVAVQEGQDERRGVRGEARATGRADLRAPQAAVPPRHPPPKVVYGYYPVPARATTWSSSTPRTTPRDRALHASRASRAPEACASATSSERRQRREARRARASLRHHGPRGSKVAKKLFEPTTTPSTSTCTAWASSAPKRSPNSGTSACARNWASPATTPRIRKLFTQNYRGSATASATPPAPT